MLPTEAVVLGAGNCLGFEEIEAPLAMDGNATLAGREVHPRAYYSSFNFDFLPAKSCSNFRFQRFFNAAPVAVRAAWEAASPPEGFCPPVPKFVLNI